MPVLGRIATAAPWCVLLSLLLTACPLSTPQCPEATVTFDPPEIPSGLSETMVIIEVEDPRPELGLEVFTEITAISGRIEDPFALQTTYACAFDVSGPVEVCATASYVVADGGVPNASMPEGGTPEAGVSGLPPGAAANVGASYQYLSKPHIRLSSPVQCSETRCATLICPEDKNTCPEVSSLTVKPEVIPEGGMATITVVADDPDDNPQALVTTLLADRGGTFGDPNALDTTYTCDPAVGGFIEICVVADDGDCEDTLCTSVRCPGDPEVNTCPIIQDFTADPMTIPVDQSMAAVQVNVVDPDEFPMPLRTELSSATGVFGDPFVTETTFTCGASGPVDLCVEVTDGDPACDKSRCITVQCPSTIPKNFCPMLFVLNAGDSTIDPGEDTRKFCSVDADNAFAQCNQDASCPGGTCSELCPGERCTWIQTRAQDTDALPFPLTLTLRALWGSFRNDQIQQCDDATPLCPAPYYQNAIYVCDRPGEVEIRVDATDGACVKKLTTDVTCPDDTPTP